MNPDVRLFDDQKEWSRATVRAFEQGDGENGPFQRVLSVAATGAGKCWASDTPMMLIHGDVKPVQELRVGECLIGPDSLPRLIVSTNTGTGPLYRLTPHRYADPMTVNGDHVLVLTVTETGGKRVSLPDGRKVSSGEIVELTVDQYMRASKTARHCLKWTRTGFDFVPPITPLPAIPPWLLGFWLADGNSKHAEIHKPGAVELCRPFVEMMGWEIHRKKLPQGKCECASITGGFGVALRKCGVLSNKHIPEAFLRSFRDTRAALLAGILDGDGYLDKQGFEICQKSERLARGIVMLARSLGFAVSSRIKMVEGKPYWRLYLSGGPDLPTVRHPSRARRKKKNLMLSGFTVEPIGEGRYHGVTISGPDRRLLMPDGTISHNTIMSAGIAFYVSKRWENPRVLFLADTDELIDQAQSKIFWATTIPTDREKGKDRASLRSKIVVGSIQTLAKKERLERFPKDHFGIVIADEAHLSMADGWQRVLNHFDQGGARSLGVTATPFRGDDRNLWDWWQFKGAEIGLFELIGKGRLAPIRVKTLPLDFDVKIEVDPHCEDLDDERVRHAIEPAFDAIIDAWVREGENRKTLWFLPGIQASQRFVQKLLDRGLTASHVDGNTKDRKKILESYAANQFQHLCNSDLLMKGYDQPDIEAVAILKLTRSRVNYQQMVGRGTRVHPGKTDMLLLDFLFQFGDLGVCRPGDLIARSPKQVREINDQLARGKPLDLREARDLSESEAVQRLVDGLLKLRGRRGETYDASQAAALLDAPELLTYEPEQRWELEKPTERQLAILARKGVEPASIKTRGEAAKLITFLISRAESDQATLKQVVTLGRMGIEHAAQMTFAEASQRIERELFR